MKIFGAQVDFAIDVWRAKHHLADCGDDDDAFRRKAKLAEQYTKLVMQVVISLSILAMSFAIIFTSNSIDVQKACFTLIGTVVGYWLK